MPRFYQRFKPRVLPFTCSILVGCTALTGAPGLAQQGGGIVRDTDLFNSTNILTPGEKDPWPITVKDGETAIIGVSSSAFDPMVEVLDPNGKKIAENDDVRPGDQDSLLLLQFPKAGSYKILVEAAKSRAGGQYDISIRRFQPEDLPVGARQPGRLGLSHVQWRRFSLEAGQTAVVTVHSASFRPALAIYQPDGEELDAPPTALTGGAGVRTVFRADTGGAYYARVSGGPTAGSGSDGYAISAAVARTNAMNLGAPAAAHRLDPGGLDLWTFNGRAGDIVRVTAMAPGGVEAQMEYVPPPGKAAAEAAGDREPPPVALLPSDRKMPGQVTALLNRDGAYQVVVSHPTGLGVSYTLDSAHGARPWDGAAPLTGKLGRGGSDYWSLQGKAGQILRVEGSSTQFDPELELYGPRGELIGSNDDGGSDRNALLTSILSESGQYLLRMHSYGDGGAGEYRIDRVTDAVHPLALGARTQGEIGPGGCDVVSFSAKADQVVIVSAHSPDFDTHVKVYGPDGIELANDDAGGAGSDSLLSVRAPADGVYTVWVFARAGGGKYSLQLFPQE